MPCTVDLVPVAPSLVAGVWPHAGPLVKRAMDRTKLGNFADVEREVLAGLQLLWLAWNGTAIDAAAVTRLVEINHERICIVVACGARKGAASLDWRPLIAGIEQFARDEGCVATRIIGRKGWQRILADYRATYVVMDRKL
jgi:hypothetical protein